MHRSTASTAGNSSTPLLSTTIKPTPSVDRDHQEDGSEEAVAPDEDEDTDDDEADEDDNEEEITSQKGNNTLVRLPQEELLGRLRKSQT